jgi:ribosomal protein L11 methyltransferase
MPYIALRFDTEDADAWSDALLACGALSVEASDPNAGTPSESPQYHEPGEAGAAPWRVSRLVALFADDADADAALRRAAAALDRDVPVHDTWTIAEQDWVRATQAQFGPIRVAEALWIVPSWCEAPAQGHAIRLDPGLAFGTGSHPTTRLCLEWLLATIRSGESMLDYGCGSGILAIAAVKLGADPVYGTDVDPQALRASADNASANRVVATFVSPDALPARRFDIVVANILANPLILLAPALAARVRSGGRLALAGVLEAQADEVAGAYGAWFKLRAWRATEGWVLLAGERFP